MKDVPRSVNPTSLGWVRKPALDQAGVQVWEKPDGSYHTFPLHMEAQVVVVNRGREALEHHLMEQSDKRSADWTRKMNALRKLRTPK